MKTDVDASHPNPLKGNEDLLCRGPKKGHISDNRMRVLNWGTPKKRLVSFWLPFIPKVPPQKLIDLNGSR